MRLTKAIRATDKELESLSVFNLIVLLQKSIEYDTYKLTPRIRNAIQNKNTN